MPAPEPDPLRGLRAATPSPALRGRIVALQPRLAPRPHPLWPWLLALLLWLLLLAWVHERATRIDLGPPPEQRPAHVQPYGPARRPPWSGTSWHRLREARPTLEALQ